MKAARGFRFSESAAMPERRPVAPAAELDALRSLWQQRLAGICVVQRGRIVVCNDRFTEIVGYTSGELRKLAARTVLPTVLEEVALRSVSQVRRESMPDPLLPVRVRRKDGQITEIEVLGCSTLFHGASALLLVVVEVNERRQAEREIKSSLERFKAGLRGTVGKITEVRDPYTAGHQLRVGMLAGEIGRTLGLSEVEAESLLIAGELHDIGKIGVPMEILALPRKLTADEFGIVKRHTGFGREMLQSSELPDGVVDAVWHHHERLDGSGYPEGLSGERISQEARIVAVADVVESIASSRSYHPARGVRAALAELRKRSGALFDRSVVHACVSLFAKGTDSRIAELFVSSTS